MNIHVVTVHWKDDRWVDVQLGYLARHVRAPFRVYAFLNDLPGDHAHKFYYSCREDIAAHATKLNLLADMVSLHATDHDDWLMFLDGDAFPVGDVVAYGTEKLQAHPLVAIQRTENLGDVQPHPAFCLTTIRFWKAIAGDWKPGPAWRNHRGDLVTDVGGRLLANLNQRRVDWLPMRRSNKVDLHPLWFGLYDDLIYHHGAGFRNPVSRLDQAGLEASVPLRLRLIRRVIARLQRRHRKAALARVIARNRALSDQVFQSILRDPAFYRVFLEESSSAADVG